MKKIKYLLNRLCFVGLTLLGIWGCSFLPTKLFTEIGKVFLMLSGFVLVVFCVLCLKRYKKTAMMIVLCFLCGSAQAHVEDTCAVAMQSSVEEGNWCLYKEMIQEFGNQTCTFMRKFNPTKVKKDPKDRAEMMEWVVNADGILDAYNALDEGRKQGEQLDCQKLTQAETELPAKEKAKKLQKATASHPVCCAENVQALYQIYNSQFSSRDIETVPTMLKDEKNQCWVCDVVYILINLANTMAYRAGPQMAVVAMFFLKWAFMFWLVLKIGMLFMNKNINGKPYSGSTFLQELLIRLLCVGLAAIVLTDTAQKASDSGYSAISVVSDSEKGTMLDEAYNKLLNPPLVLIAEVGINVSDTLRSGEGTFFGKVAERVQKSYGFNLNTNDYCNSFDIKRSSIHKNLTTSKAKGAMDGIYKGRVIGEDLTQKMLCLTQQAFRGMSPLATLGSLFLTDGIKNGESLPLGLGRLPKLAQCIYGLVMMLCCWAMGVSVAFRLIDITIRLSIFILLAPILIALAVFPITRDKAKAGVRFVVSAIMGFIELSIGVALVIPFFMGAIARTDAQQKELLDAIVAPGDSNYVSNLYNIFSRGGFTTFVLVSSICWMGKFLLDASQKFFSHIFGTQNVGEIGGASMAGAVADMRGTIGGMADWTKTDRAKMIGAAAKNTKVGRGMTKMQQGVKNSAAGAKRYMKDKASQASNYVKNSKVGRGAAAAKNGIKNAGQKVGQKVANSKVGQAAKALANSKVGRFAKGAGKVAGGVLKGVGSMGKEMLQRSGKFAKSQAKKGVHDFFHPEK